MTATPLPLAPEAIDEFRRSVVGTECLVPTAGGERPFINFDHAASTPPFAAALAEVNRAAPWYANVHRGAGTKARLSTWAFDEAREEIHRFIGADERDDITLFTRNTTESVNHLASALGMDRESVVLVTQMEHHSNDLPWRRAATVIHVGLTPDGAIDEHDLQGKLHQYRGRVRLLAVTGASNVTGLVNPVHRYARWAHAAGAEILVDAAQLAAHRRIGMHDGPADEHLDYLVCSGHKMYAPFGVGVLSGSKRRLEVGTPFQVGGGTVDVVDLDQVTWGSLPDRGEAGTPCVLGAIALAAATREYHRLGWDRIERHEQRLTRQAWRALSQVPGLALYAVSDADRLGVIAFNLEGMPHALLAAILNHEWGIGTRSGCFCAHPYLQHLLELDGPQIERIRETMSRNDRSAIPGAVRVSFGLETTSEEIDHLVQALGAIGQGRHRHDYRVDRATGDCLPSGFDPRSYRALMDSSDG